MLAASASFSSCDNTPKNTQIETKPNVPAGIYLVEFKGIHGSVWIDNKECNRSVGYAEFLNGDTAHKMAENLVISGDAYDKLCLRSDSTGKVFAPNRVVVIKIEKRYDLDGKDSVSYVKQVNPEMKDFWKRRIEQAKGDTSKIAVGR